MSVQLTCSQTREGNLEISSGCNYGARLPKQALCLESPLSGGAGAHVEPRGARTLKGMGRDANCVTFKATSFQMHTSKKRRRFKNGPVFTGWRRAAVFMPPNVQKPRPPFCCDCKFNCDSAHLYCDVCGNAIKTFDLNT